MPQNNLLRGERLLSKTMIPISTTAGAQSAHDRGVSTARTPISKGPASLIVTCAMALIVMVAGATGYILTNLRDRIVSENERQLANTSLILAQHLDHMIDAIDTVHRDLIEEFNASWTASEEHFERLVSGYELHSKLRDKNAGMRYVGSLSFFNPQGKLVNFSRQWPVPDINVADRDFFQAFQSTEPPAFYLSRPHVNRASGSRVMHFTRRVESRNGKYLGLISAAIELDYLLDYLKGVWLSPDSAIALFRSDGMLLLRQPMIDAEIGKVFKHALALKLVEDSDHGVGQSGGIFDGRSRIVGAHRLARYPVIVATTNTVKGALADWQRAANYVVAIAGLIVLGIVGFTGFFIRSLRRHQELLHMRAREAEADKIREQNLRFDAALNNMTQGLLMFDASARLVVYNERYLEIYGLSPGAIVPGDTLLQIVRRRKETGSFVGDPEPYCDEILAAIRQGKEMIHLHETADGRMIHIVNRPMEEGGWVGTHEDVTERIRAEKDRDRNQRLLDLVVDNVPAIIVVKDAKDLRYALINRAAENYFGVPRSRLIGKTAHQVLSPASADFVSGLDRQLLEAGSGAAIDEHAIETADGRERTAVSTRVPILDERGNPQYLLNVVNDVTEQRRAEARIVHMAHHDALTDLPNRTLLRDILDRELQRARDGRGVAVHYLDLDNFKSVNDTLGHTVGDELIKIVAERMRNCLRQADTIARFGGDEFVIIQTEVERPIDAADLAQAVRAAIVNMPVEVSGHQVVIDASIGIALAPGDSMNADELLKYADMALYGAKADGRGSYNFFEPKLDARMKSRRALEVDLRRALGNGEFELHYQPVVSISDGTISGLEALLRWRHPERGLISPAEFIPIAEEIGLIVPLGEWVLREACAEATRWPARLRVSVNISPVHFIGQNLVPAVVSSLAASGLAPDRLEVEITEAVLLQNTERTLGTMQALRGLGVRIAMDDFGVGYSSLSYLRNYPFTKIKIDRSFVQDMVEQDSARSIVRAVIALGASLGMTTTAEGIETQQQFDILRAEGCDEMQGHLFSPARPAAEIERLFLDKLRATAAA